jgi:N-acetylglucosamine-6-sulfatase
MNLTTLKPLVDHLTLLTAVALSAFVTKTAQAQTSEPANVVFILTDDHRFDAMSCAGHPFLETPHMDAIAASGAFIKNTLVTTSLCSPSHASILTGLYTHKHGVIDNSR